MIDRQKSGQFGTMYYFLILLSFIFAEFTNRQMQFYLYPY